MIKLKFLIYFFFIGVITSFLFPPFFLLPLGFIIFPILLFLLNLKTYQSLNYKWHFFSGCFYGLGFFSIYLSWINEPFLIQEITKKISFFSYLLIIYCSIYFGIVFLIINYFKEKYIKFITLPLLIVIAEFICANFIFGFPWLSFSLIHAANKIGTSIIFYIGTYGLSLVTIYFFLFPSILVFENKKVKILFFITYIIFFIILLALNIVRADQSNKIEDRFIKTSIIQLNNPLTIGVNSEDIEKKLDNIIKLIKDSNTELIIFAENDYPYIMDDSSINLIKNNIRKNQNIIIGSTRKETNKFFNSLFVINKNEYFKFDKKILVPFGEFIPFRFVFSFMEFIAGAEDFTSGIGKRYIQLNKDTHILPVICYEILYFWKLLDKTNKDSNIIINITNDFWFGKFSGPYQHFYFSKLRAAEFNKPLIRVSSNGISAYIDNYGNIIDYIKLNERSTKILNIKIIEPRSNFQKIHKSIIFFIFFLFFVILFLQKKHEY